MMRPHSCWISCIFIMIVFGVQSVSHLQAQDYNSYKIYSNGAGANNTMLYTIECDVKNISDIDAKISKGVIYCLMYNGSESKDGYPQQTRLIDNTEDIDKNKQKIIDHILNDDYHMYVTQIAKGNMQIIKRKSLYRIIATVSVDKRRLRKKLEDENIINKLMEF